MALCASCCSSARGIIHTVNSIKEIDADAKMVHVEATGLARVAQDDLRDLVLHNQHRGYLSDHLISGQVAPDHFLYRWLVEHGATVEELAAIASDRIALDVIGLNFYPQWSTQQIYVNSKGKIVNRLIEKDGAGFEQLIQDYSDRYRIPLFVTETSAFGAHAQRSRWLAASLSAIRTLRGRGVAVHGYTWFPLFTMYKWDYRRGTLPLAKYRFELGLYQLDGQNGNARFRPTPLVQEYQVISKIRYKRWAHCRLQPAYRIRHNSIVCF